MLFVRIIVIANKFSNWISANMVPYQYIIIVKKYYNAFKRTLDENLADKITNKKRNEGQFSNFGFNWKIVHFFLNKTCCLYQKVT